MCVAVGEFGTRVLTSKGGASWHTQSSTTPQLEGINCPTSAMCMAVGVNGAITVSTNGGASWKTQSAGTNEELLGVNCASPSVCLATGYAGTALATTDGGATWQPQPTSTLNPLYEPAVRSGGSVALIVGQGGTIQTAPQSGIFG